MKQYFFMLFYLTLVLDKTVLLAFHYTMMANQHFNADL